MDDEHVTNDQPAATNAENKGFSLSLKVIVAVVAIAIIAFFAYSLAQQGAISDNNVNENISATGQTETPNTQAVTESDTASHEDLFEQGNAYFQAGQVEEAVAAYKKAIALKPDYQAAYANLGVAYYQLEQLDLAAVQYETALELDPNDGEVAYNLGALQLQQALLSGKPPDPERVSEAIAQLEHALELAPDLAEPHFSLGVAYETLLEEDKAIQQFERFLAKDSGKDPRASQEAQRYLESLKSQ